jgi:hypothetical protein
LLSRRYESRGCFHTGFVVGCGRNYKPSRGEEDRVLYRNTTYHYHGKAVLAFALGLIMPLYVNPFFSVIKPSLLGESS